MFGLYLLWCLCFSEKSTIFQDASEGLDHLKKALENLQACRNTMECLHGLPASSTVTQKGTFWFCGQKPSCEFFCPDQDCYMFGKAATAFRESGCLHPRCYGHGRLAKMRMVKDTNNQSYGRPFFVCSERDNPCSFWQWGDVFEGIKPVCNHNLICRTKKVKKEGPNQDRLFYCCSHPRESACDFFAWKPDEDPLESGCTCLFSMPPSYRYTVRKSGETFTSHETDRRKAYEEFLRQKEVDELIEGFSNMRIS
jgi:hypothetical protein